MKENKTATCYRSRQDIQQLFVSCMKYKSTDRPLSEYVKISEGTVVQHHGNPDSSKRVGWRGVIISTEGDYINVLWIANSEGKEILDTRSSQQHHWSPKTLGLIQTYTRKWAYNHLKASRAPVNFKLFKKVFSNSPDSFVSNQNNMTDEYDSGKFIFWSEADVALPKQIYTSLSNAESVATRLSEELRVPIFTSRLIGKYSPVEEIKIVKEKV